MAITQSIATSFKQELMMGLHNFSSGGNAFKLSLYLSAANLDSATTVYTATGETSGTGYVAGGNTLTNVTPAISGTVAFTDFADSNWPNATITARGAMIYNSTNGNRTVAVLDFGSDKTSSAGDFTIVFPSPDATNAIIRII